MLDISQSENATTATTAAEDSFNRLNNLYKVDIKWFYKITVGGCKIIFSVAGWEGLNIFPGSLIFK